MIRYYFNRILCLFGIVLLIYWISCAFTSTSEFSDVYKNVKIVSRNDTTITWKAINEENVKVRFTDKIDGCSKKTIRGGDIHIEELEKGIAVDLKIGKISCFLAMILFSLFISIQFLVGESYWGYERLKINTAKSKHVFYILKFFGYNVTKIKSYGDNEILSYICIFYDYLT